MNKLYETAKSQSITVTTYLSINTLLMLKHLQLKHKGSMPIKI